MARMTTDEPYVVSPADRGSQWKITKGEPLRSHTIEKYETKQAARVRAQELAKSHRNVGVVVLRQDGTFQTFEWNEDFWSKWEHEGSRGGKRPPGRMRR